MGIQVSAQIVGQAFDANVMLFRIKERLQLVGLAVQHPYENRLSQREFTTHTYDPRKWSEYEITLDLYEMMKKSAFHVISNDTGGIVDAVMARSMLYAMVLDKPIILTNKPFFAKTIPTEWRDLIAKHEDKLTVVSLLKLNNADLQQFVTDLAKKKISYKLNKTDKDFIVKTINSSLDQLLEQGR